MKHRFFKLAAIGLLAVTPLACGDDDGDAEVSDITATSASNSNAANTPEGPALVAANQMIAQLRAMPDGGLPTVANFQSASTSLTGVKLTGLDDSNNDGKDDDAKATVEANNGDDKACIQHQNGAWEVTDDEC
jgi:hypothetical protein